MCLTRVFVSNAVHSGLCCSVPSHGCCLADTPPDFPEAYLMSLMGKEISKRATLRRLNTYQASRVTPSGGLRFGQLRQAILETLAPAEVKAPSKWL